MVASKRLSSHRRSTKTKARSTTSPVVAKNHFSVPNLILPPIIFYSMRWIEANGHYSFLYISMLFYNHVNIYSFSLPPLPSTLFPSATQQHCLPLVYFNWPVVVWIVRSLGKHLMLDIFLTWILLLTLLLFVIY